MENYIIIGIIIIAAAIAIVYTVRHFQGKGGCCGGGDCTATTAKTEWKRL